MALRPFESPTTTMTAYHVNDGPTQMYPVDANSAASRHPDEWSLTPWSPDDASAARQRLHDRKVAEAKAAGAPEPAPLVEPELTDEEKAALAEWRANRDKAQAVLDAAAKEQADKDAKAAELAQAQADADAPPPQPDPNRRRPLTGAAKANADRTAAKAAADKAAADKAAAAKASAPSQPAVTGPVATPASAAPAMPAPAPNPSGPAST